MNILFVCLGNICRSPLAAAVCRKYIAEKQLDAAVVSVESAGTLDYHNGEAPDRRMAAAASRHGIYISNRSKSVLPEYFETYDLILAMDSDNYADLLEMALQHAESRRKRHEYTAKIRMFRDFDPEGPGEVPDPYYGDSDGFELVLDMAERTCRNLAEQLASSKSEKHADNEEVQTCR